MFRTVEEENETLLQKYKGLFKDHPILLAKELYQGQVEKKVILFTSIIIYLKINVLILYFQIFCIFSL